jgi:organic radical activating enzyme
MKDQIQTKPRLSILILTHNRPKLFQRAIDSVLNIAPGYEIEILVNNDTEDIEEVYSDSIHIQYFYNKAHDLSKIYKLLFDRARGEFIYFLEDDDFLNKKFFDYIDYEYDINYFHYISEPHIVESGPVEMLNRQKLNIDLLRETQYSVFIDSYIDTYFQLGQILFKKKKLIAFPSGNNIRNDVSLFRAFDQSSTIKYIDECLWHQTTDGNDNISFDNLNTDDRFSDTNISINDINSAGNPDYELLTFAWDLIDVCQYKCTYCSAVNFNQHTFSKNKNLLTAWKNVIKTLSLSQIGLPFTVELLGGEPSLHPDIIDIITALCGIERCIQVELTTNLAKPISFFERFDTVKTNKLDVIASYHPEYYTDKFCEKIIEMKDFDHIFICPLINLPDEKKYWKQTIDLIERLIDNNVSISLNLLYNYEGMSWYPGYTDEFWETFSPWIHRDVIDDSTHLVEPGSSILSDDRVMKGFNNKMTGVNSHNWTNRKLIEHTSKEHPIIANRGRWFNINGKSSMLTDSLIYKNILYKYKGWNCRPLLWNINMDGSIENHCTRKMLPIQKVNQTNLTACVSCPLEDCDCNTKFQYIKTRP